MEGGNYILEGLEAEKSTFFIFSMKEEVGALAKALKVLGVSWEFLIFFLSSVWNDLYCNILRII